MEVYLNVCAEYGNQEIKKSINLITESIENHGLFQKEIPSMVESHLKEINVLLQSAKTRHQGFQLLLPLIQQGSPSLLEKRCDIWFGACCQAVTSLCGSAEKIDACKIILTLLKAVAVLPELQKSFLTKSQTSLIQSLATADSSWDSSAFDCLHELIKFIPGQCIPQKVLIEENMLKYLDHPLSRMGENDIVRKAGKVFAVLPLPGIGGNKALGKAEARGRQLTQLLALAHKTMDSLFEGVIEKEEYTHTRDCTLNIPRIKFKGKDSGDTIRGFLAAVTRLGNILKFVSQMVTSEGNNSISVVPYHLLSPIFRLLQVDSKVLKAYRSQEHQILSFLIVSVHHHCLWLLRDMIMSIGESIDIYFGVIGELLVSMIKMSLTQEEDESGWCASGIQTRILAYSVLTTVLQVSRGRHAPTKVLANLIVKDILPRHQQVTLQKTQKKGLQSLTLQKKKKKKGYAINQNTTTAGQNGPFFQAELVGRVTRTALALTETLFINASHSMPHKIKQILQKNLLNIVESVSSGASLPVAYASDKTRAQMYRTLGSIATHPDPRCPPPYTMILHLLHRGQQDSQMLVVTACQLLIGNISFIITNPKLSLMDKALQYSRNSIRQDTDDDLEDSIKENICDQALNKRQDHGNGNISDEAVEKINISVEIGDTTVNKNVDELDNREGLTEAEEVDSEVGDETSLVDEELKETRDSYIEKPSETIEVEDNEFDLASEEKSLSVTKPEGTVENSEQSKIKVRKSDVGKKKKDSEEPDKAKRKAVEESPASNKKSKKKNTDNSSCGPSLEEMLSCFVDADPDV